MILEKIGTTKNIDRRLSYGMLIHNSISLLFYNQTTKILIFVLCYIEPLFSQYNKGNCSGGVKIQNEKHALKKFLGYLNSTFTNN